MTYEYRVVAAPRRADKHRGAKSTEDRFTRTLEALMNEMAAEGWEYQRADSLPCEERHGLTGRSTVYQSVLIFRREAEEAKNAPVAVVAPLAAAPAPVVAPSAPASKPQAVPPVVGPAVVGPVVDEPPLRSANIPPLKAE